MFLSFTQTHSNSGLPSGATQCSLCCSKTLLNVDREGLESNHQSCAPVKGYHKKWMKLSVSLCNQMFLQQVWVHKQTLWICEKTDDLCGDSEILKPGWAYSRCVTHWSWNLVPTVPPSITQQHSKPNPSCTHSPYEIAFRPTCVSCQRTHIVEDVHPSLHGDALENGENSKEDVVKVGDTVAGSDPVLLTGGAVAAGPGWRLQATGEICCRLT